MRQILDRFAKSRVDSMPLLVSCRQKRVESTMISARCGVRAGNKPGAVRKASMYALSSFPRRLSRQTNGRAATKALAKDSSVEPTPPLRGLTR